MTSTYGTLRLHADPPRASVVASGEFDVSCVPAMAAQIYDASSVGCHDFVLDLGRVTFLDATTVGVLVGIDRRARGHGGSLTIVEAAPCVRRILALVGLGRMLA